MAYHGQGLLSKLQITKFPCYEAYGYKVSNYEMFLIYKIPHEYKVPKSQSSKLQNFQVTIIELLLDCIYKFHKVVRIIARQCTLCGLQLDSVQYSQLRQDMNWIMLQYSQHHQASFQTVSNYHTPLSGFQLFSAHIYNNCPETVRISFGWCTLSSDWSILKNVIQEKSRMTITFFCLIITKHCNFARSKYQSVTAILHTLQRIRGGHLPFVIQLYFGSLLRGRPPSVT